jgi:RNA polymerase-binding transcription factor DksA
MINLETRRAELRDRLKMLEDRGERIREDLEAPVDPDVEERAVEREGDEVLEGLGASGEVEQRMIRAALARIDAGDYGHCTHCGAPIAEARLDALPWTPYCRDCAR